MGTKIPVPLVDEIRARVGEWICPGGRTSVRVSLDGSGEALATCEVWAAAPGGRWTYIRDLPAGIGTSMLDLGRAICLAGYVYELTPEGRPAWQVDHGGTKTYTLDVNRP